MDLENKKEEFIKMANFAINNNYPKFAILSIWVWIKAEIKAIQMQAQVKPTCGHCIDCKYLREPDKYPMCYHNEVNPMMTDETGQHLIYDIQDFGCIKFESNYKSEPTL